MKLFRVVLIASCVAAGVLLTAGPAYAPPPPATPLEISKSFSPSTVPVGSRSTMTLTVTNPALITQNGIAFSDTLPASMTFAGPVTNSCQGGTTTVGLGPPAFVSVSGATLAASSSCTVTADVTTTSIGVFTNTTGNVSSAEGGTGNTATASLTVVVAPPSLSKSFGAATLRRGDTTTLTFALVNPNTATSLSGVVFTDPLPLGLRIGTPTGLVNTCGGIVQAVAGSGAVSLSGVRLAPSEKCSLEVNVTASASASGVKNNQTTPVTSNEAGLGNRATASITVTA